MSLSSDLLEQARHLAARDKKKPKQANLRRAVSTAYYALFHYLGEEAAKGLAGSTDQELRNLVRRALVHGKMKDFCIKFNGNAKFAVPVLQELDKKLTISTNKEIVKLSKAFCDLQHQRHEADYNLAKFVNRPEALNACDQVKEAIEAWEKLKLSDPKITATFLISLLLWPSLNGR